MVNTDIMSVVRPTAEYHRYGSHYGYSKDPREDKAGRAELPRYHRTGKDQPTTLISAVAHYLY